jgi:hypothetical protein
MVHIGYASSVSSFSTFFSLSLGFPCLLEKLGKDIAGHQQPENQHN